jgi:hypothetical protein
MNLPNVFTSSIVEYFRGLMEICLVGYHEAVLEAIDIVAAQTFIKMFKS